MKKDENKINVAAVSDLHINETTKDSYKDIFSKINEEADVLLLCGDLTNLGLIEEAELLIKELSVCKIPILAVLGNHDFENDKQEEIQKLLIDNKVTVLEGTEYIYEKKERKIGFTGVKGFGGGFNPNMWGRFGEKEQKEFYDAVATEVQKLEIGLNELREKELDKTIVLLHFSPIRQTVEGDIVEMYPFLGSSRLEEVIDRYDVNAVFHGHSHLGNPDGKTAKGIDVYNVAYPLMQKINPEKPYKIVAF